MNYHHYRDYKDTPMADLPRDVLEEALWRCSRRDRELILGWWDADRKHEEYERRRHRDAEWTAIRRHQLYRDLERVVKDQRNHIANLEAELLPHLVDAPQGVQESLA